MRHLFWVLLLVPVLSWSQEGLSANKTKSYGKDGYFGCFQFGELYYGNSPTLSIKMVNGIQSPHVSFGLGVGYENNPSLIIAPIYADLREYISTDKVSPLFYQNLGFSLGIPAYKRKLDNYGGGMGAFGAGLRWYVTPTVPLMFCFGYKNQATKADFLQSFSYWDGTKTVWATRTVKSISTNGFVTFDFGICY
jgi:hypothetical protein